MDAIPWRLDTSSNISLWRWETDHFRAKIQTDAHRVNFLWDIDDISQGRFTPLADGHTGSFRESEDLVREIVGKSYKPTLGYAGYSGRFATTFTIFTGEKIDFGPMQSTKVFLQVRVAEGTGIKVKRYIGRLSIDHYDIRLTPEHGNPVKVPPSRIVSVQQEFGGTVQAVQDEDALGKTLRIYPGALTTGCTGKPGFMDNTVEHPSRSPRCPIHEP